VNHGFTIFTGTANSALAAAIARQLGVQLGACAIDRFPDGEVAVQLLEPARRQEVFLVQPTSPPVNDHLVELLALADACRPTWFSSRRTSGACGWPHTTRSVSAPQSSCCTSDARAAPRPR
jgi:phosphoribosylpyrophosphate synthetase